MAIWYRLWLFGVFSRFGMLCQEKSGANPTTFEFTYSYNANVVVG
jgi:hypothetical protein